MVLQCTAYTLLGNEVPDKLISPLRQVRVIKHERYAADISLQKHAQVLCYACHVARSEDLDEADAVELIVRVSALDRETIRSCARVLSVLGYTMASDRLQKLVATHLALGKRLASRHL